METLEQVSAMWLTVCVRPIMSQKIDATERCLLSDQQGEGKGIAELTDYAMFEYLLLVLAGHLK
jgi:hypothetical protein